MTTWIIAYNKDGNTSMLKIDSEHQPDIDDAVELVTRKAEELYRIRKASTSTIPISRTLPPHALPNATASPSPVYPRPDRRRVRHRPHLSIPTT